MAERDDFDEQDLAELDELRDAAMREDRSGSRPSSTRRDPRSSSLTPRRAPDSTGYGRSGSSATRGSAYPTSRSTTASGESQARREYRSSGYGSAYRSASDTGFGGSPPQDSAPRRSQWPTNLTVIALVALISFFAGFASRNTYDNVGGFDDERIVTAQEIPIEFRNFCISYNGLPSFTVVQLTSVSTLLMSSVPIIKLDTCMIPVNQTANALQALGVRSRQDTIGPQLGGSNLTLLNFKMTRQLAEAIVADFPQLTASPSETMRVEEEIVSEVERIIDDSLTQGVVGLDLQGMVRTNISGVYVVVPGHSFELQPDVRGFSNRKR